jgi:hypothetical protein
MHEIESKENENQIRMTTSIEFDSCWSWFWCRGLQRLTKTIERYLIETSHHTQEHSCAWWRVGESQHWSKGKWETGNRVWPTSKVRVDIGSSRVNESVTFQLILPIILPIKVCQSAEISHQLLWTKCDFCQENQIVISQYSYSLRVFLIINLNDDSQKVWILRLVQRRVQNLRESESRNSIAWRSRWWQC